MPHVTLDVVPPQTEDELINAVRGAFTDPIEHRKNKAFLDLFEFLTPESARRIVEVFGDFYHRGINQEFAWRTFWTRWGEIDGADGLEFAIDNPSFARSGHLHIEMLMSGWSAVDPTGAERWLRAHPNTSHHAWMAAALVANEAVNNVDQATSTIFSLPLKPDELERGLGALAETLRLSGGAERVANWFENLPDAKKAVAYSQAAARIKDGDLPYVKKWFAAQAAMPWAGDKQLADFINKYSNVDSASAAQWVTTMPLPASDGPSKSVSLAFERWAAKDSGAALQWLSARGSDQSWAGAARGYLTQLRKTNPTAADAYLQTLDSARREALEREVTAK